MSALMACVRRGGADAAGVMARMAAAAPHRGADVATVQLGAVTLGVVHGSGAGDASVSVHGAHAAALAGELDNADALLKALTRADAVPPGRPTPADMLVALVRAFGPEVVGRLRGVYAGAVTDGRTLWCFRDHMGFAPLHMRADDHGVLVATEIKQVIAGAGIRSEPDLEALTNLFYLYEHSRTDERRCAMRGVERVPRRHLLRADPSGVTSAPYWEPERLIETARLSPDDIAVRFAELMTQASHRVLRGRDVVALSGGVDSPAVAAFAAPAFRARYARRLPALSGVYPAYPSVDESRHVRLIADAMDLELHTYEPAARPTDGLVDWVRLCDGPVPGMSMAAIAESLRRAHALGATNMLTGEFAEFVFDMGHFALDYLLARGRLSPAYRYAAAEAGGTLPLTRFVRRAMRAWTPGPLLALYRRMREGPAAPGAALVPWMDESRAAPVREFRARSTWRDDQLTALEGAFPALEADSFAQAVTGVATRRPWTDIDLWEFFLSLRAESKHPTPRHKALVRRLVRGRVPDAILDRTDKTVFDEAIAASIDYPALDRWLLAPNFQLDGIRYDRLGDALRGRRLSLIEFMRAKDLASIHAFLSLC